MLLCQLDTDTTHTNQLHMEGIKWHTYTFWV